MLKTLLKSAINDGYRKNPDLPVYLQFSAGCDSTALFFAMKELERPFICITYCYKQPKIYMKRINYMCETCQVPLQCISLTEKDVHENIAFLKKMGFKGRVLLDCLSGHLSIASTLKNSIVVNGSYADVLYGSYFFHFKPTMTKEAFDKKRMELLIKPDQDGVISLTKLLETNNNILLTPFADPAVVGYFLTKTYQECGGSKKTLFRKEFAEELSQLPFKIHRKAQQIESGIRDLRRNNEKIACEN